MNDISVKRKLDDEKANEPWAALQAILEKMRKNYYHVEKCVEFSKEVLTECCNKLEDLRSQMSLLESIIGEAVANSQHQFVEGSKSVQTRDRLKKFSDQEIIEEITIEGNEKLGVSSKASKTADFESRRKRQRGNLEDDEIAIITQPTNDKCTPGPSRGLSRKNIRHSEEEHSVKDKDVTNITETNSGEDPVETALRKTNGVLSAQELSTFLSISENVQDPVQLAKVSFTNETKKLYYQLMTFHFHLKIANDIAEEEQNSIPNRELENRVQRLIHAFQAEV